MPARVRAVDVPHHIRLEDYRSVEHLDAAVDACARLGAEVGDLLGTGRVWMLNSTETGGGVAEMLPREVSLLSDVGVDCRWLVLEPDDVEFFRATKLLHNMIHGEAPGAPMERIVDVYRRVSDEAARSLRTHVESDDLLVVHDPQPLAAGAALPSDHCPCRVWRCHIGLPWENEHTRAAWAMLEPHLGPYQRLLFSSERYVPAHVEHKSGVLHPGIDPLSHKNRELRPTKLVGILRSAGLVPGPAVPEWARFRAPVRRLVDGAFQTSPIDDLLFGPFVLQVSRFDRLKGFHLLIPAFERLLQTGAARAMHHKVDTARAAAELSRTKLVLAGPDPAGVADDPEAQSVLDELVAQHAALPADVARRVHVLLLPMESPKENALVVNALQRAASVVAQCSIEEGFGLTVTEALWKATPVVASDVGGIGIQIRPGTDGLLVEDAADPDALAAALFDQLFLSRPAAAMAASGRRRVAGHFLLLVQVRRWLEELRALLLAREARRGGAAAHP